MHRSPLPNISTLAIHISPENPPPNHQNGVPKMNFPNSPDRGFLWKLYRHPGFPGIPGPPRSQHFGVPLSAFWGNEVDMLGHADTSPFESFDGRPHLWENANILEVKALATKLCRRPAANIAYDAIYVQENDFFNDLAILVFVLSFCSLCFLAPTASNPYSSFAPVLSVSYPLEGSA